MFRLVRIWGSAASWSRLMAAWVLLGALAAPRAATFVVINPNDGGEGSLRWALTNANATPGFDNITFSLSSGPPPYLISLATALPAVIDPVSIDGTTQPGYSNKPVVVLDGLALLGANGLTLSVGGNTVRGLVLQNFPRYGIEATAAAAGTNTIQGCFIGTDATGTMARTNLFGGIHLGLASDNRIGGTNTNDGNVISGNGNDGIWIDGQPTAARNVIVGNWIGTTWGGTASLGNAKQGIRITTGQGNVVGGPSAAERNVISGNGENGVSIEGPSATNNVIQGNYIGLNGSGLGAIPNKQYGLRLLNGARLNQVGGTDPGAGNVISGNLKSGVDLSSGAQNNFIQGNFIGPAGSGTNAIPNGELGVAMSAATNNLIGGTAPGARNVISGNSQSGIYLVGPTTRSNRIEGNYIGVDAAGSNRLGNAFAGVWIANAPLNFIGSSVSGGGNVISGNGFHGIYLQGSGATSNCVYGNFIGTDSTGARAVWSATVYHGVAVDAAPANWIGSDAAGSGNLISGNYVGVFVQGMGSSNCVIQQNLIGPDVSGMFVVGNTREGVVGESTLNLKIGGGNTSDGNVISGNGDTINFRSAIYLTNAMATVIQGNKIGVKADGVSALGNKAHNIDLERATNTVIGGQGPAAWNVIANALDPQRSGIRIRSGFGNLILGNSIYANGRLGITFNGASPTPNDGACDSDLGPNGLQNYPVITNAVSDGSTTAIKGYLMTASGQTCLLQFYATPTVNPSGYWEGKLWLGSASLPMNGTCTNAFAATLSSGVPAGWRITATATDAANNTSEFSPAAAVGSVPVLTIAQPGPQQTMLSWLVTNTSGGSWQLVTSTNLTPPTTWSAVTNAPTVTSNGTWFTVTLTTSDSTRFFRLLYQ
jgi:hypothetical protein